MSVVAERRRLDHVDRVVDRTVDVETGDGTPEAEAGDGDGAFERAFEASPLTRMMSTIFGLLATCVAVCVSALAVCGTLVAMVTPSFVSRGVRRGAFAIGYGVYDTAVGRALHARLLRWNADEGPHSRVGSPTVCGRAVVIPVPFLADNYSYLVVDAATKEACVVDPGDPRACAAAARRCGVKLTTVLTTHKHHDHAGGNGRLAACLKEEFEMDETPELKIYGHAKDKCHGVNALVEDGDVIRLGSETRFLVRHVPCHTLGHVVYAMLSEESDGRTLTLADAVAMFTGDAIINGGVGAFFHGDAGDCHDNLHARLAEASDKCLVFSGHEYMEINLRFAKFVDPDDHITANAFFAVLLHRHKDNATMPSSMAVERRVNPFFRCADRAYLKRLLETKKRLSVRSKRPWWHRYFGPSAERLAEMREASVDASRLARLIATNEQKSNETPSPVATREEIIRGIELLQDLMSDAFGVLDLKNGDEEERKMFMQYARAVQSSGTPARVVVSQLVAPGAAA